MKKRFQNIFTDAKKKNGLFLVIGTIALTLMVGMFIDFSVANTKVKENFNLSKTETNKEKEDKNIFGYNSKFLKKRIAYALKEIGVKKPYKYKVISHKYNKKISRISYYVQIQEGNNDSFDYLTISFLKGSDGWMTDDYYLEK